jgi:hypothetical protein
MEVKVFERVDTLGATAAVITSRVKEQKEWRALNVACSAATEEKGKMGRKGKVT